MTHPHFRPVIHYLRTLALRPHPEERGDVCLLERFVANRDESAFAVLVHRYGPMVLAVCRRVLRDVHDAEDCFQAVFLVLARKAASLRDPERLGNWLHGVAYRIAVKARARSVRRRRREQALVDVPAPTNDDLVWRDLRPLLDEEIQRLPIKYRMVVVLCYLEGATNAEAALRLGWTRGTVATRLAWARQRLRLRLIRRGVALPVGALTVLFASETMRAAVPSVLAEAAIKCAASFALGNASIAGTTPALALAKGVLKTMTMNKIPFAILMLLTASAVGVGVGWLARTVPGGTRPEAQQQAVLPPVAPRREPDANDDLKREVAALRKEMGELKKHEVARPATEAAVKTPEPILYLGKPASDWLAALHDRNAGFRYNAIEPLGSLALEDHALIPALIGCLKDDDHEVRERAVVALARIGPPAREAVPILLRATLPVGLTVYGLRQIDPKGQQTIPAALALLKETQPLLRRKAAFALLVFDKSKARLAIADFVAALKRKGNEVNSAGHWGNEIPACNMLSEIAAWALGEIGPEAREAVPALVEALRSPPNLPQLGSGFPSAEPYESALKCVDPEGKEAIPLLMKVLTAKGSVDRKPMDEWCRVIRALAQYGPKAKAVIPALRAIVKNTEKFAGRSGNRTVTQMHDAAVEALKKIDPTTTPSKPVKKGNDS